jgi:hypothetical protein
MYTISRAEHSSSPTELVGSAERKHQTQTIGFYYIDAYASGFTPKLASRLAICGCAAVRCVERSDDAGAAGRAPTAETYSSYAAESRCTRRASARQLTRMWTAAAARTTLSLRVEFEVLLLATSTMSGIPHVVDNWILS